MLAERGLLNPMHPPESIIAYAGEIIDGRRAAIIAAHAAKTAGTPPPPTSPPPPPSAPDDFGNRKKIPPTPEQVTAYFLFIDYPVAGEEFCDFYAAKGWKVGNAKMKDWQAACRNWKRSAWGQLVGPKKPGTEPRRITKF